MKPGDRYPAALAIAHSRFQHELDLLATREQPVIPGSPEYDALKRRFVPPYPVDTFVDKWRKLIPDQPAWTWTVPAHLSKDAYSHIHYDSDQARAVSIREAARLQSFPDAFAFLGNMGECFRQVGNAVPPLVAWGLASNLLQLLGFGGRALVWPVLEPSDRLGSQEVARVNITP
jgi:DNA (cytosine-5)-methyltransferase 1